MELKDAREVARSWLLHTSNDESYIDASTESVLKKLTDLIMQERENAIKYALEQSKYKPQAV